MENFIANRIKWETDGSDTLLPKEVEIPGSIDIHDDNAIADYLSDTYGYLVESFSVPMVDGDIDEFGLYVNEVEGKVS